MICRGFQKGLLMAAAFFIWMAFLPGQIKAEVTEDGFTYELNADGVTVTGYQGGGSDIAIPQNIGGAAVTEIADEAFKGNDKIYSLTVGPDIRRIGREAFSHSLIGQVYIEEGESVLTIEASAFYQADSLGAVSFSGRPTVLGSGAFSYSDRLSSLDLPENVTVSGSSFAGCVSLREVTWASPVVASSMFYGCGALWKVTLADTVTAIGDHAFYKCESLTDLGLSEGLTEIGKSVFGSCSSLAEITLPGSLQSIGEGSFSGCSKIASLYIPAALTNVAARDIRDLTGLGVLQAADENPVYCAVNNILYDKDMTEVIAAAKMVRGSIVFPDTLVDIRERAFDGCGRIEEVTFPQSLLHIGENAFASCSQLKRIVIPDNVQGALLGTFEGCTSLTYAEVGDGICALDRTFVGCSELTEVNLSENITDLGGASFSSCEKLEKIRIPSGVTRLGGWDFYGCESLKKLEMPKGLTYVGFRSLQYCRSLSSLTFYEDLAQVSDIWYAMADNDNLQYVLFHGPYVKLSDNVFTNMNPNFVVFRREQYPEWEAYTHYQVVTATDEMLILKDDLQNLSVADTRIDDKERLLGYKEQYEALTYLEQRLYLDEEVDGLQECLDKIEALEVGVRIDALPDADKLEPDDKTAIRDVERAYNALGASKQAYLKASQKLRINRILSALAELLAVKDITLGAPAQAAGGSYTLKMAVGEVQTVPVAIIPDYAEDRKLDVQSDGQDKIVSAKIQDGTEEVQLTAVGIGTAHVVVRQRGLFERSLEVVAALAAPKNVKAGQQGAGAVALSWDRSSGAGYYEIYRKTGFAGEVLVGKTQGNVGIYVDKGLKALTSYSYRVTACTEEEGGKYNSSPSKTVQVTVDSNGAVQQTTPTVSPSATISPKASIKLNYSSLDIQKGKSTTVVKVKSSAPKGVKIASAKSSRPSVVSVKVKKGKLTLTGKKVGTAQVTVTGSNKATAKVKITVKKKVRVSKLTLNKKKASLKRGRSLVLKLTKKPVTATDKITWSSSDKKVATVTAKGVVKAKKKGTAVIRVKASGGKKVTCKITVK